MLGAVNCAVLVELCLDAGVVHDRQVISSLNPTPQAFNH